MPMARGEAPERTDPAWVAGSRVRLSAGPWAQAITPRLSPSTGCTHLPLVLKGRAQTAVWFKGRLGRRTNAPPLRGRAGGGQAGAGAGRRPADEGERRRHAARRRAVSGGQSSGERPLRANSDGRWHGPRAPPVQLIRRSRAVARVGGGSRMASVRTLCCVQSVPKEDPRVGCQIHWALMVVSFA